MKLKKILSSGLFLVVVVLLMVTSNYPMINLLRNLKGQLFTNADVKVEASSTLFGDIAYVKAIIDRTEVNEQKTQKKNKNSETSQSAPQLIYLAPSIINMVTPHQLKNKLLFFSREFYPLIFIKIISPPPQSVS